MSDESDIDEASSGEPITYLSRYIGSKREAKALMKLHADVIDYYISKSRNVDASSLKKYYRSIADFMAFDPTLNPEELNNFIKHKLFEFEDGTQSQAELERIFRQSTQHVTKFIKILYKDDMLKYNILPDSY